MPAPAPDQIALEVANRSMGTGLALEQALKDPALRIILENRARYHMQRRALLSRRLLAEGMAPAEVAAACGYVDQSHMHREFRRRFGLTPGAYRSAWLSCNPVQDRTL